jgi:hypothetical protein
MALETIRHLSAFDPHKFSDKSILVIGAGAVGSSIVLGLAKLGLENITVWDDDVVEPHNLSNQYPYGPDDIERLKVNALRQRVYEATGTEIAGHKKRYLGGRVYANLVFMCVDTMTVRKQIAQEGCQLNPKVEWVFDTRVGYDARTSGRTAMSFAYRPFDLSEQAAYYEMLYDDAEASADIGTCGNTISIGATAQIASQTTICLAMDALNNKLQANEVIADLSAWTILKKRYPSSVLRAA